MVWTLQKHAVVKQLFCLFLATHSSYHTRPIFPVYSKCWVSYTVACSVGSAAFYISFHVIMRSLVFRILITMFCSLGWIMGTGFWVMQMRTEQDHGSIDQLLLSILWFWVLIPLLPLLTIPMVLYFRLCGPIMGCDKPQEIVLGRKMAPSMHE